MLTRMLRVMMSKHMELDFKVSIVNHGVWSVECGAWNGNCGVWSRGSTKTSISCETSANFHSWKHAKRTGFAAPPKDTARPQENQRLETRHVGAPKGAFRARLPPILTLCSIKIDVFLRLFSGTWKFAIPKSMFRARLPSIFSTSHKMPRPARNLHLVATWRSPANAIRKKHATRHF